MKKKILLTALVASFIFTGVYAEGDEACKGPECSEEGFKGKQRGERADMFKDLNLTEEQQQQLKAKREKNKDELKSLHESSKAAREKYEAALESGNPEAIKSAAEEMKQSHNAMLDEKTQRAIELAEILTPEQLKKFNEKKKQHREKRQESKENRKEKMKERFQEKRMGSGK